MNKVVLSTILLFVASEGLAQWAPNGSGIYNTNAGNVGIGHSNPPNKLTIGSDIYLNPSNRGITLGSEHNSIELVNSSYGNGYGAKVYGVDEGSGVTSLRFAIRGNSTSWTDAFYVCGANTSAANHGFIGIGTTSPTARLHVHEDAALPQATNSYQLINRISGRGHNHFMQSNWLVRDEGNTTQWWTARLHDGISIDGSYLTPRSDTRTWWERDPMDNIQSWGNGNQTYLTINQGNVGIGTTTPDYKLTVDGGVKCEEVKVEIFTGTGPDYVFEKNYNLLSLSELETFINQNKHLPEVPSAKEMEAEGLNLKEMNLILLKKVEELTLHLIDQNRKINSQNTRIEQQEKRIDDFKKALENK
jgi:hypothetical protein